MSPYSINRTYSIICKIPRIEFFPDWYQYMRDDDTIGHAIDFIDSQIILLNI